MMSHGESFRWTFIIRMLWERAGTVCLANPASRIAGSVNTGHKPQPTPLSSSGALIMHVEKTTGYHHIFAHLSHIFRIVNIRFRNGQSLVEQSKFIFGMSHFLFPFSLLFLSIPPALSPKSINEGHWFSKPQTLGQWRHRLYSIDL